jgi:AcrR family transcriptional regulator
MVGSQERPGRRKRPPDRPSLTRDRTEIFELLRSRVLAAAIGIVEADGVRGLTIAKITGRARVSHKAFYDVFLDCEDCFLVAFEQTLQNARESAQAAYREETNWRDGVRAAVLSGLALMERERGLARLCIVEALAAGPLVLDRRARALQELAHAIEEQCASIDTHAAPQPLMAEAVVGGMAGLLHARLLGEDDVPLTDMLGPLMSMIAMPYLGRDAACEELNAPAADAAGDQHNEPSSRGGLDLLADLDMRFTYRTVRVLAAIADAPGASNSQIAQDAGIVDQGQVSKLLARLARLGLVENDNPRRIAGGMNAWRLTARGEQVRRAAQRYR